MTPAYLQAVYAVTNRAKSFGHRVLSNGTELVGHVPHVAPEAWLHQLFAPLKDAELTAWEQALGGALPPVLRTFYTHHNGLNLFSTSLAIHGLRHSYERTGDAAWQPFHVDDLNRYRRGGPTPGRLYLAGYNTGPWLSIDLHTHAVQRTTAEGTVVHEWAGFDVMLVAEAHRLAECFDEQGRRVEV
ncbi:SMI1/KNR4 family protein [Hymenobacter canadensis]|uniref:SMI1/KNR4 family protein n=1 Tax=Hymenobacter canadensis TaxID=2999067 RepID=A0ABY7LUB3_9BACT|nr:SMI1/KNR4 family protein [Hymenobacter canadensis]WBA43985.1 SMI1/KNR4 family protein [Hymenobacter canadensis]